MYNDIKKELHNFKVYIHITPNCKYYVGITCQPVNLRWKRGLGYEHNLHFTNAVKKYGWDNIQHEILAENLTLEEACNFEKTLISKLRSNEMEYGYNQSTGGEGALGRSPSEETRKKISESVKKLWLDEDYRRNISAKLKVRFQDEEYLKKHSEKRIGLLLGEKHHSYKMVRCLNTNEKFFGASEAGRKYNVQYKNILKVCHGERNCAGTYNGENLRWEFVYDD